MKTKQRVVITACSDKKFKKVELKNILDKISKGKLEEKYGKIKEKRG